MIQPDHSGPLRIFVSGWRMSNSSLCEALAQQPGITLAGSARDLDEAAPALGRLEIDVVVHAIPAGPLRREELAAIRQLTPAPIVLLAEGVEHGLFEEALDADVADVVVLPQPAERIAFAVRKAARMTHAGVAADHGLARVVTVFSPKGGTGKTVVCSNLATGMAKHDRLRTLFLDLDLQFGDAAIMLGLEPEQTLYELGTAPGELDADKLGGYMTRHAASGADVLAAPLRPEDGEAVSEHAIERLLEVARPMYQAIVIDTSPSFHGPMLSALDSTDVLLLLCTPEVPTLKNVRLGIETLRRLSFPEERMRLVLNRADAGSGIRRAEVEDALGIPVAWELPTASEVPVAVNQGSPLSLSSPASPFAVAARNMSRALVGSVEARSDGREIQAGQSGLVNTVRGLASGWLPSRGDKTAPSTAESSAA